MKLTQQPTPALYTYDTHCFDYYRLLCMLCRARCIAERGQSPTAGERIQLLKSAELGSKLSKNHDLPNRDKNISNSLLSTFY